VSETTREGVRVELSPTRCPFCKDELAPGKPIVACAACGARHHDSCYADHGRCATCGSEDKLVPAAPRKRARSEPLAGSKIRVVPDGSATVYEWRLGSPAEWVIIVIFAATIVLLPLVAFALIQYLRERDRKIRITPDEIEFPARAFGGLGVSTIRARRAEVTKFGVVHREGYNLTVDIGATRHIVKNGLVAPKTLSGPEVEWLADQLNAWREG
jgi:hypothetical protein